MSLQTQLTQKRREAESLIRQHAPERLQESLIELLRPAIALHPSRCDDAQIPLGASKFGGAPDVPQGFEWPTWNEKPLGFLAQINLVEVAPFDVEGLLPKAGLLSFFYEYEEPHWGAPEHKGAWRVFYSKAEKRALKAQRVLGVNLGLSTRLSKCTQGLPCLTTNLSRPLPNSKHQS